MNTINRNSAGLELAQIGWVVPDIHATVNFLEKALGIAGFSEPEHMHAQDLGMTYYGQAVSELHEQGYAIISKVGHPIARMAFFDTYQTLGVATEIMGITLEGWLAIGQMQTAR